MRTKTYTSVGDKTLRCLSTTTTTLLKEKIISGVRNESNDEGTGHMRKETRDDKNERIMKTETLGGDARIMKLNEVILRQITQKKIYNNTLSLHDALPIFI